MEHIQNISPLFCPFEKWKKFHHFPFNGPMNYEDEEVKQQRRRFSFNDVDKDVKSDWVQALWLLACSVQQHACEANEAEHRGACVHWFATRGDATEPGRARIEFSKQVCPSHLRATNTDANFYSCTRVNLPSAAYNRTNIITLFYVTALYDAFLSLTKKVASVRSIVPKNASRIIENPDTVLRMKMARFPIALTGSYPRRWMANIQSNLLSIPDVIRVKYHTYVYPRLLRKIIRIQSNRTPLHLERFRFSRRHQDLRFDFLKRSAVYSRFLANRGWSLKIIDHLGIHQIRRYSRFESMTTQPSLLHHRS